MLLVEDEWLITAHDKAPSHDGASIWFMLRIPDGKVESGLFHIQSSEGCGPHLCRLRTDRLAPVNKIDYVLAHMGFMGSRKLSSFDGH
jgi:hypothetical protein